MEVDGSRRSDGSRFRLGLSMGVAEALREWNVFYSVLAGSTATLFGLLFFAVTLNARELHREQHERLFQLASLTFSNFLLLFVLSLQMLMPTKKALALFLMWMVLSVVGFIWTLNLYLKARKASDASEKHLVIGRSFRMSFFAYAMLFLIGLWKFLPIAETIQLVMIPVMMLLASSIRNSWGLMILIRPRDDQPSS